MGERHISFVYTQSEWDFVRRLLGQDTDRTWTWFFFFFKDMFLDTKELISSLRYCRLIQRDNSRSTNPRQTFSCLYQALIRKGLCPSGIHLQPESIRTVLGQATTPIKILYLEWPVLWNHEEESARSPKQESHIRVVWKDSRGLPEATEHRPSRHPLFLLALSFSQDVLHDLACSLSFPLSRALSLLKTSVWASVGLRSLGVFVTWFRSLQIP